MQRKNSYNPEDNLGKVHSQHSNPFALGIEQNRVNSYIVKPQIDIKNNVSIKSINNESQSVVSNMISSQGGKNQIKQQLHESEQLIYTRQAYSPISIIKKLSQQQCQIHTTKNISQTNIRTTAKNKTTVVPLHLQPIPQPNPITNQKSNSLIQSILQSNRLRLENTELKTQNTQQKKTISKLRFQLEQKVQTLNKFNQLMKIKYNEMKEIKASMEQRESQMKEAADAREKEMEKVKVELWRKNKELDEINDRITNLDNCEEYKNQVFRRKIVKLQNQLSEQRQKNHHFILQSSQLNNRIKELQQKVTQLTHSNLKTDLLNKSEVTPQKIENLTPESEQLSSSKNSTQSSQISAFNEALNVQMKQIIELKQVIELSQQQTQKLKENLILSRNELQSLLNELRIWDLKASSQRKNLLLEYDLMVQLKDNKISDLTKNFRTLQQKYKIALNDINFKDQFFRQHLIGRTNETNVQEYVENTMNLYMEHFGDLLTLRAQNSDMKCKLEKYEKYERLE